MTGTQCNSMTEVGSPPGEWVAFCDREEGHTGPHTSEYTWEDSEWTRWDAKLPHLGQNAGISPGEPNGVPESWGEGYIDR